MPDSTAQATLSQGSKDFSSFVAFDGVQQGYAERNVSSVVTMDGVLRKKSVKKRTLSVKLIDMFHEDLISLFSGIPDLASWSYLDAGAGAQTADFYLSGPSVRQKIVRDGHTWCSGISFELEAK